MRAYSHQVSTRPEEHRTDAAPAIGPQPLLWVATKLLRHSTIGIIFWSYIRACASTPAELPTPKEIGGPFTNCFGRSAIVSLVWYSYFLVVAAQLDFNNVKFGECWC